MVVTTSLPPGFRFHPTDVELVWYYLKRKVIGKPLRAEVISEIDLYKFAPWDLPDKSCLQSKDLEWYFFCPQDRKYASGSRTNRSTDIGYWKITGRDRSILHDSRTVGFKKTLVFYVGTAPRRERTDWVMHEFRLEDKELVNAGFSQVQNVYVLCKIFQGSGPGPKYGKQYGAPFREEDWEDDVVSEKEISTPCLPCSSPRPLDDLVILSEPVLQQSVASGVAKLPSTPDIFYVDAVLDQLIEDPDDSSHLSENANGESGSGMLHKSATEVSGVCTQDVPESENLGGQVEQEPNDIEEMFKSIGELEPIDNYYFSGNLDDEYTFQPTPLESGNEQYADVQDLRILGESDHFDLVVPHQLLDNKPFANFVSFRGINTNEFPNYSADNALSTSPGRILRTGPDLLDDQSILIPEMDGPKEMDCQHEADMCPQNVCVSEAEEVGSFLVQNVAGGSSCKSLSCFDPSTDCYSDWENYSL